MLLTVAVPTTDGPVIRLYRRYRGRPRLTGSERNGKADRSPRDLKLCTNRRLVARSLAQALRTVAGGTVSSARDILQAPRKVNRVGFDMMQRAAKRNGGIVKSSARTHTTRRTILHPASAVA